MRKLFALMLALLMVFSCAAAKPQYDFSDLTMEELAEAHRQIEEEIERRFAGVESVLPSGLYVGGETIRAGSYVLFTDETYDTNKEYVEVYLFSDMDQYDQYRDTMLNKVAVFHTTLEKEQSAFVTIEKDMVLFTDKAVFIKEAGASWLP